MPNKSIKSSSLLASSRYHFMISAVQFYNEPIAGTIKICNYEFFSATYPLNGNGVLPHKLYAI